MTTELFHLPFGRSTQSVRVPTHNLLGEITPRDTDEAGNEKRILAEALAHPVGTPRLRDLVQPRQSVVIVTSDLSRPCPSHVLIPPLLRELNVGGVRDADITVVVALGLHRPLTTDELERVVGSDVYGRVRVINHDRRDTLSLGSTTAGTPVEIFRPVVEADVRVCVGNLELHYFAGYSGGAKAVVPGCASEATIRTNHRMMMRSDAVSGTLEGNPLRADLEDAAGRLGVHFILNVLVDGEHSVVGAVAGDVGAAHRRGCRMVAERAKVNVPRRADVVLVSAGGYPKDIDLYQAQKALDNAGHAVRPGGIIILAAECAEGSGNRVFETWMRESESPEEILNRIERRFELGGHKAAAIARIARRARIFLVSSTLASTPLQGIDHYASLQAALDEALARAGKEACLLILPRGGSVLPAVKR